MYARLFQPLAIGPRTARNRILFGSHTTNFAQQHLLSQRHSDYYAARASGGAGIIVLEEHIVHSSDLPYESALQGYLPETPRAIANVVSAIHQHDSLTLVQLNHNGQQSTSDHHQHELWAPSPVPNVSSREVPKAMELSDIQAVIAGFALTARHATSSADGVELQVADSSLLRQFLSPLTNQRYDQYGGSLENRLRFLQETIEAVDAAIGDEHILGLRFCADELAPWAGLTPEQSLEMARILVSTGRVDYMTVTMGSILSTQMFPFHASMHVAPGYAVHLAAAFKATLEIPVFAAGRIMQAAQAEKILAEEQADGVEMIRALIADPLLPRLSQEGQPERVRPCIACNQGCQVRGIMNAALSCNVNPDVIHTTPPLISVPPVAHQRTRVHIVGGGPAGLEAARTAAMRGHPVTLYERAHTLGGAVSLAAKGPGRDTLRLITDYLAAEIEHLDVEMRTDVEVTPELLIEQHAQTVIVATGARPARGQLPIPGSDLPHVVSVRAVLAGEQAITGERVLVVDESDSHGALSAAELLAAQGKSVEIVSGGWYIGSDLTMTHDIVHWMQRILALLQYPETDRRKRETPVQPPTPLHRDYSTSSNPTRSSGNTPGVVLTPHTSVVRIEPQQVILTDNFAEGEQVRPIDVVLLGTYEQPEQGLYYALKGRVPRLLRAGDCVAPRRIEQAILEGRRIGEQL
jgi:mycofactocin system FadH/OYE family oxidoreductase 2